MGCGNETIDVSGTQSCEKKLGNVDTRTYKNIHSSNNIVELISK